MNEIKDIREIQLKILDIALEFHRIMTKHHIPYYMIGGTMLGAVRHGGFIPWDDDMDFGVPRIEYERAKSVLRSELLAPYKLLFGKVGRVGYDSAKIEDTSTSIIEKDHEETPCKTGLFIDIFPIDVCNNKYGLFSRNRWIRLFFGINSFKYVWPQKFYHKIVALIVHLLPENFFRTIAHRLLFKTGDYYINYSGMYGAREIVPKDFFGTPILYKFEDVELFGVENYDKFLSCIYGDYVKLPPEEKRHSHIISCYLKG